MITVSAKTLEEAITKAKIELQTSSDNMSYEIVENGSSGFLGFGAKPFVIKAELKKVNEEVVVEKIEKPIVPTVVVENKNTEVVEKPIESKPSDKSFDFSKIDDIKSNAESFLNQVLGAMNIPVTYEINFDKEDIELEIVMKGEDMGILIGKRGQTLDSLQYLTSLVVNKKVSEGYVRVKLDTENYRERRKETLQILAKNISYKVKRTRKPVSLEPMNPYERRIIHSALQNDKYVVTKSEGENPFRHVVILPKRENYSNSKRKYQSQGK